MAASTDLNIIIKSVDQTDKEFKKMMKNVQGVQKELEHVNKTSKQTFGTEIKQNWLAATAALAGATVAIRTVTEAFKEAVQSSSEFELNVKKLSVAVENTGTAWISVKQDVLDFADAMQETTVYGNTETLRLLQQLTPYTNDVGKAMEGAKIAMDMASAGLFDINTASKYVGMAMQGNVEMLGRYIGELRSNANEQLKTMTAAEKTAYALDLLKTKYGGMAEAEISTFTGAQKQLANAWSDFMRAIGDFVTQNPTLISGINDATQAVLAFAEALQKLRADKGMTDYLGVIKDAIANSGIANYKELLERVLEIGNELGMQAGQQLFPSAPGSSPETPGASTDTDYQAQQLAEEIEYWAEKVRTTMEGNDAIKAILEETSSWKEQMELEEQQRSIQNKIEETKQILDLAKLDQETQTKLSEYKTKLMMSEATLAKKIQEEKSKEMTSANKAFLSNLKTTLSMGAQENRAFAIALKAVNIGEAIMNTAEGVTQALKAYPPPLSFAMAAATAALGATQVGIIASQGFAQGTDSVPAMLTPGEMVFPRSMADAIRGGDIVVGGRGAGLGDRIISNNVEITISGVFNNSQDIGETVAEAVSRAIAVEAERI